jgi:peptide/nickel transport system permease protein
MKRLSKNKIAMTGLVIILILFLLAILSPWIMPYKYDAMNMLERFQGPSLQHLCGTDDMGRDIFSRLLYGARASLSLGFLATIISTVVGMVIGSIVGYFGGIVDTIIMRLVDILQAIPGILLAIAISACLGSGFMNTVIALSIGGIPMTVRLLRGSIMGVRKMEYLEAAQTINCSVPRTIIKHILPNSISPIIVSVTMGIGNTILMAASLSYIGLGVQPPTPEWGAMLSAARTYMRDYPHMVLFPGIAIALVVLSLNMLGDGLRDALDPKLKQ